MTAPNSGDVEFSLEARLALVQRMLDEAARELAEVLTDISNKDPGEHGGEND